MPTSVLLILGIPGHAKIFEPVVTKGLCFMRRITYVLLCIIYFFPGDTEAQDPAFSQFFASPLTLNPALTGKFNGAVRIAGNYRNQWPQINNAYITSTVSVGW